MAMHTSECLTFSRLREPHLSKGHQKPGPTLGVKVVRVVVIQPKRVTSPKTQVCMAMHTSEWLILTRMCNDIRRKATSSQANTPVQKRISSPINPCMHGHAYMLNG